MVIVNRSRQGPHPASTGSPTTGRLRSRRRLLTASLLIAISLGLLWRRAPLHLSPFAFKYGGSALWAMALYWLLAALFLRCVRWKTTLLALLLAALLEFSRLWHLPALDAFRLTLAGKLLLGRVFSLRNIVAYWLAILAAALLDGLIQPNP